MDECHVLFLRGYTLLSTDFLQNFRKMCLEIYELDLTDFFSALGLAQQAALKKAKLKLELLTYIDMLLLLNAELEEYFVILLKDMQNQIMHNKTMTKIKIIIS